MYNTKFVQKLAFAYRNCPLSLETTKHFQAYTVVKVDRRIRWHYTTTILRLRIGARLTRYRNCKFHNFARAIGRHADGISRYSVPPSAGPLLPLSIHDTSTVSRDLVLKIFLNVLFMTQLMDLYRYLRKEQASSA